MNIKGILSKPRAQVEEKLPGALSVHQSWKSTPWELTQPCITINSGDKETFVRRTVENPSLTGFLAQFKIHATQISSPASCLWRPQYFNSSWAFILAASLPPGLPVLSFFHCVRVDSMHKAGSSPRYTDVTLEMRPEESWSHVDLVHCEEADSVSEKPINVDEEDGGLQVCRVCGDKANGYHFNVMTCEGCKGFFRRAMKRNVRLRCPFRKGTCEINRKTRRQCQACRLRKCLDSGMKKEMIMSDAAVEQRRALIKRKKREKIEAPLSGGQGLTEEQQALIQELMDAQMKTFDTTFSHFKDFRLPAVFNGGCELPEYLQTSLLEDPAVWSQIMQDSVPMKISLKLRGEDGSIWNYQPPAKSDGKEIIPLLPHLADVSTYMFKGVINFAKVISYFRDLPIEDQISLLKGATFEMCLLRFNTMFDTETGTWECGRLAYCFEDPEGGFQKLLLDPLIKFHYMLKKLQLHKEEYVLMQAISLFSPDRPGVVQRNVVDQLQERFALTLKAYIEYSRPSPAHRFLFLKIMAVLTELRSINAQQTQQLLRIQDSHPFATPLMQELFSSTDG